MSKFVRAAPQYSIKFTKEGGLARYMTYTSTAGVSQRGMLLSQSTSVTDGVKPNVNAFACMGVAYTSGVATGNPLLVVFSGTGDVRLLEGEGSAAGDYVAASTVTPSYAFTSSEPPGGFPNATIEHFQEIGHCLETQTSAAGVSKLARIMIHFN